MDDATVIINAIKQRYPQVKAPPSEDICYATTNRQHAVRVLAPEADLVLVVGSKNSSNSVRLTEIAANGGTCGRLVDDASEIDPAWLDGVETILLTAGASAPEHLVDEIIQWLEDNYGAEVDNRQVTDEDMHFELPRSLRVLRSEKAAV
jgi:4-hydroxy-3-methylbut-2-enyl diphosphate reductase